MKKFIILTEAPFTDRDFDRFQCENFVREFVVEIVDVTAIFFPESVEDYKEKNITTTDKLKKRSFSNQQSLFDYFQEINEAYILMLIGSGYRYVNLYKILKSKKYFLICYQLNVLPNLSEFDKSLAIAKTSGVHHYRSLRKWKEIIYNRVLKNRLLRFPVDLYIISGEKSFTGVFDSGEKTKFIKGHSADYDQYLELKDSIKIGDEHIVFIDQFVPFHPDLQRMGFKPIAPAEYYKSLNKFFDFLEKKLNKQVVIAAHPISDYDNSKFFKNRPIIKHQTVDLIARSSLVLSHGSTALSYSILFKKPILGLNMNVFVETMHEKILFFFSKVMGFNIINIDDYSVNDFKVYPPNHEAYQDYVRHYMAQEDSVQGNTWKYICRFLVEQQKNKEL